MKARLVRLIFATHRWTGVILGLLMLLWCLSGFVMIWAPYPSVTLGGRDYRTEGLAPIRLPDQIALPDMPDGAFLTSARIEMLADRPVLSLAWEAGDTGGGRGLYDLANAAAVTAVTQAEALQVARTYARRHGMSSAPSVKRLGERDEFTVAGYFNSARPFYEVRLNDSEQTLLYISAKTGEVRQRTTSSLRFWSWLGAIPHWLYFTELRKDAQLWGQVVIWTSLAGCFLTVLGLFVGVRQFRRRHSTGRRASPYHGAKFWHHMLGLVFGVLVLTWTFSGFTSMQPWGWLDSGPETGRSIERLTGDPPAWADARPALEAQAVALRANPREVSQVSLSRLASDTAFIWRMADGSRERIGPGGARRRSTTRGVNGPGRCWQARERRRGSS